MNNKVEAFFPLTSMQQGILFHALHTQGTPTYFQQVECVMRGPLDAAAFVRAWERVAARHAALRAGFVWEEIREPIQIVHSQAELSFDVRDWRDLESDAREQLWRRLLSDERERGFDLTAPPLLRLALARVGEREYRFAISYHHIILDGWSLALLIKEAFTYHEAYRVGNAEPALIEPPRFRDYVTWVRRQSLDAARDHWQGLLKGFNAPTTLGGRSLQAAHHGHEVAFAEGRVDLTPEVAAKLQALVRARRLTPSTIFYGAWGLLLSRHTGSIDVVFGVTVSGRMAALPGIEAMVGLLVNTLPVRLRQDEDEPLLDWLHRLQTSQVEARQYEYTPLAEIQNWSDIPRGESLFESIVVFENYPVEAGPVAERGGLSFDGVKTFEMTNYPLTLLVGSRLPNSLRLIYNARLFSHDTITRLLGHLRCLLESIAADTTQRLSSVEMLTDAERQQLLGEWNDTRPYVNNHRCIHQLFEDQASRTPDTVAVIDGEERVSYSELNRRARLVAEHLRARGAGTETTVGVCLSRSVRMLVGLLGVLKTGAAYVPLDPDYPRERFNFMLADSRAVLLLTEPQFAVMAEGVGVQIIYVEGGLNGNESEDDEAARTRNTATALATRPGYANLAYVIYTSGSTGTPKGTAIEHRQAVAFLRWADSVFGPDEKEQILASTSICFDLSIFEMFLPLSTGGAVVMAQTGLSLPSLASASSVRLLNTVPSVLSELLKLGALPRSLRTINLAGEPLQSALVRKAYEQPGVRRIYNLYGPSEDTTYSTYALLERESDQTPPIGQPITGTQAHLLDRAGRLTAVGVIGEIHLGGVGLARGYLNRPDLTAERFVPDPFGAEPGGRLYRTGDLARRLTDGRIEFLGRTDHQVKLRGFRIELGEIEVALCRHPSVLEAVVAVRESRAGEKQLAAFVIPAVGHEISARQLRDFIHQTLPAYMMPSAFVFLEQLPLTPNGKIDRRRLPEVEAEATASAAHVHVEPRNDVERRITEVWREVLSVEKVGVNDNFFDLGGHSLLLLAAYARLRKGFERDLSIVELLKHPTISALAEHLTARPGAQTTPAAEYEQTRSRRDSLNRLKDFRCRRQAAIRYSGGPGDE